MELSVLLDLPVPAMAIAEPGTNGPGGEGAEADAFAALLAALVGAVLPPVTPPTPEPIEVAEPEPEAVIVAAFSSPQGPVSGPQRDQKAEVALAPIALAPIALPPAFSSPPQGGAAREEHVEPAPEPALAPAPPPAKAPTTHPAAHLLGTPDPVVALTPVVLPPAFSSPPPPQGGGARDEKPGVPVVVPTEVVRLPSRVVDAASVATPTAPAAPAAPATPAEQVVKAVAPLRRLPDGTHRIVLELRPADLGAVRVELSIDAGMVHLGLRSDIDATAQVLHAALPEIRSQLDAAGLVAGRLAVDAGPAGRRDQRGAWETDVDRDRAGGRDHGGSDNEDDTTRRRSFVAAPGRVDVLL